MVVFWHKGKRGRRLTAGLFGIKNKKKKLVAHVRTWNEVDFRTLLKDFIGQFLRCWQHFSVMFCD